MLQDAVSLGGTARVRASKERFEILFTIHERMISAIQACEAEYIQIAVRISKPLRRTRRQLNKADLILSPLRSRCTSYAVEEPSSALIALPKTTALLARNGILSPAASVGAGITSGFAASASSWGLVQVVGHASTGTAMLGLHGAAAANAGWAWFGGGSLATGGGGMALGHALLPGLGTVVAVGVSSFLSHKQANRLEQACNELEEANQKNEIVLSKVRVELDSASHFESQLEFGNEDVAAVLTRVRRKLFRFGWLSRMFRYIRYRFTGEYYRSHEFHLVEDLATAVDNFISSLSTRKA